MGSKKKKGKYAGKTKLFGPELLKVLLMVPIGILFLSLKGSILGKILLSAALLYFSYFWKKENPLLANVILIIAACMPWFTFMGMSQRQILLSEMVLMYVSIGALLYFNIKYHCSSWQVLSLSAFFMVSMIHTSDRYTYIVDGEDMQNWPVYLAAAIVVAVVFIVLAAKNIIYIKDDRASESIGLCLFAALLGYVLSSVTINNLNYMLDQSEPAVYEMVIEEKNIDRGYKSRTDYYIFFDHGGKELKMEVSSETYAAHEVGDTVPVMLYDGAFDKPYFIIE